MKKNLTNYANKMLGLTAIAFMTMLPAAFCQEPAIDNDLIIYSMAVAPDQQVKFRLPKDIRSGDMITGTVIEEKKNNAGAVNKTSSTLQGMVIEIDGKQTRINNRFVSFIVPAGLASIPFLLKNSAGEVIGRGQVPVGITSSSIPNPGTQQFVPDAVSQPGQTLRINGAFDGNASNTNVSMNGQAMETIAESPRMTAVQVSENATAGVSKISIAENNVKEDHKINIARLNLTADKTNLRKGQKTTIQTTVTGLEDLTQTNMNFKLRIENLSPQTISFLKAGSNVIEKEINTGNIKNGQYEFSTKIIALTAGVFSISANLTAPGDDTECAKAYKECVDAVNAQEKDKIKAANDASNGTGAREAIAKIMKWATDAREACYKAFEECRKNK